MIATGPLNLSRYEAPLLRSLARVVAPPARTRPSDWAERHVVLTREQAARPGPFSCDWKPWTRDLHDLLYLARQRGEFKRGVVSIKGAQIGWTRVMANRVAQQVAEDPRPILYVTTEAEKAKTFCNRELLPTLKAVAGLARVLGTSASGEKQRTLMWSIPFPGGRIDVVGAGSESKVVGDAYAAVYLDEYEAARQNFPREAGDLLTSAENRLRTFGLAAELHVFGHPRLEDDGLHALWTQRSDQGVWCFDCPHCSAPVEPMWDHVRYERAGRDGEGSADQGGLVADPLAVGDPSSAVLGCPHCGEVITDAQRARAVWPAALGRGGTGRFVSRLVLKGEEGGAEARAREFCGAWIPRLSDPEVTVAQLARELAQKKTESEKLDWINKTAGQPKRKTGSALSKDALSQVFTGERSPLPAIVVPGPRGPGGPARAVWIVSCGVDVQHSRSNPVLYATVTGYAPGLARVLDARRLRGFDALGAYLANFTVARDDGTSAGIDCLGIDAAYETGQVLDFCRLQIASPVTGRRVELVPVRFSPRLSGDNPAVLKSVDKRTDATRPHLGPLAHYYELFRHHWVDRVIRRMGAGGLRVVGEVPDDFAGQLAAQILAPVAKRHGMESERLEWAKAGTMRDDWLMSAVYGEAAAALVCFLDRIQEYAWGGAGTGMGEDRTVDPRGGGGEEGLRWGGWRRRQ